MTPDPSLPDPAALPVEPISWALDRIEATSKLYDDAPVCSAGCTIQREIVAMGAALPRALSFGHERSCRFAEVRSS